MESTAPDLQLWALWGLTSGGYSFLCSTSTVRGQPENGEQAIGKLSFAKDCTHKKSARNPTTCSARERNVETVETSYRSFRIVSAHAQDKFERTQSFNRGSRLLEIFEATHGLDGAKWVSRAA